MNKEYVYKNIGNRKIQEDNYIFFKFVDVSKKCFDCYMVFDGHGGESNEKNMPYIIINKKLYLFISTFFRRNKVSKKTIIDCFIDFDNFLKKETEIQKKFGTCISGAFISQSYIYLFNIGDTEYFLIDKKGLVLKSVLHNFYNEKEICRYKKNNLKIKNNRYKGLAVSRSVGDYDCKKEFETSLISCPSVSKTENNSDFLILLKTDGVNISNKELIKNYKENNLQTFMESKKFSDNTCLVVLDIKKKELFIQKYFYKKIYTDVLKYI